MLSPRIRDVTLDELRDRLRRYALGAGGMSLLAWVVRLLGERHHGLGAFHESGMLAHLCTALTLLAGVPLTALLGQSRARLVAIDAAITVGSNVGWCAMGSDADLYGIELMVVLAMSSGMWLRSVMIPSSARRTLLLCLASCAALLLFLRTPHRPPPSGDPLRGAGTTAAVRAMVWWAAASYLAVSTSRLVHGLREQVSKALRVGQYSLEEKLGEGGMGVVYRARHALLRRATAVKLLPAARAGAKAVARFEREVRVTATLTHPNTVTIFDYGRTPEGTFYYAMELLDGASLQRIVDETGPFPAARIAHVLRQVAAALAEAHDAGLVHRDIKPANIVLCRVGGVEDVAKVLDFGIVREHGDASSGHEGIVGTPEYMSPEAISAPQSVGAASDLYSLGAVAVFLATGAPPFDGGTVVEVFARQQDGGASVSPLARAREPLPPTIEGIIDACLMQDPKCRPSSARAIVDALDSRDVPRWTETDARAFWSANDLELRKTRGGKAEVESIGVDLDARLRGTFSEEAEREILGR